RVHRHSGDLNAQRSVAMLRYLALVWDEANPQQQETARAIARRLPQSAPAWRQEFSVPGMQVFCAGVRSDAPRVHRVGDDSGIVIGTVFKRKRDLTSPEADP